MRPAIEEIDHASNKQPYQDPDPCPNSAITNTNSGLERSKTDSYIFMMVNQTHSPNVDDQVGVD